MPLINSVVIMLLGGNTNGGISASYEDLIVFLFVHNKANKLSEIRAIVSKGKDALTQAAYDWVDEIDPVELAEGVDYFTATKTRIELLSVKNITDKGATTEKKTLQAPM